MDRHPHHLVWLLPPLVAVLAVVIPHAIGERPPPATAAEYSASVQQRLPELLDRDGVPGASIALVVDGEMIWAEGFGVRDLDTHAPVVADTVFQAGSISKSLIAWAVMTLAEQDEVALEAAVDDQIEGWTLPDSGHDRDQVTPERLLAHTSGLPFAVEGLATTPDELRRWDVDPARFEVVHEPGAGFVYSNPGYAVLGLLLQETDGRPLAEVMADEVLDPLGMHDSTFQLDQRLADRAATGHTFDHDPVDPAWQSPIGPSGLHTTAPDLARFVAAHHLRAEPTERGALGVDAVARLQHPRAATSGIPHALMADASGLGHFVDVLDDGTPIVLNGGEEEGWIAGYAVVPDTGDGIVVMTNSRHGYPTLIEEVAAWSAWRGHGPLTITRTHQRLTSTAYGLIALFAALTLLLVAGPIRDLRAGRRPIRPWSSHRRILRFLLAVLAVLLLLAWWGAAARMLAPFVPHLTPWLSTTLTAGAAALATRAAWVPTPPPRHGEPDRPA